MSVLTFPLQLLKHVSLNSYFHTSVGVLKINSSSVVP